MSSSSKPDFYHEITCKCGKYSYINDFTKAVKRLENVCEICHTKVIYLKTRRCDCGNCESVACFDPNKECDICNGNISRKDLARMVGLGEDEDDLLKLNNLTGLTLK